MISLLANADFYSGTQNLYKIVSELLGHSSITITLDTYFHIINPLGYEVANTLDEIVGLKQDIHVGDNEGNTD